MLVLLPGGRQVHRRNGATGLSPMALGGTATLSCQHVRSSSPVSIGASQPNGGQTATAGRPIFAAAYQTGYMSRRRNASAG
jgi:hypothetical protein